jgi:phospholipase C
MPIPIQHVVVIAKENPTFDDHFGTFRSAAGVQPPRTPDPRVADPLHDHAAWLAAQAHGDGLREQYVKADIGAY